MKLRPFNSSDVAGVISLWLQCNLIRPANNPEKDIQRKLRVDPELFLVGVWNDQVIATVMIGYEGHRGWLNYVAVAPSHRRKGFGRILIEEAERLLAERNCPKVNLQVLPNNAGAIEFYRRLGYVIDNAVSMGRRLEFDEFDIRSVSGPEANAM
jgi:ribosomal protein S18 acetylase RimI-like enzyme